MEQLTLSLPEMINLGRIVLNYDSEKKAPCPGFLEIHESSNLLQESLKLFREEAAK
jgi:hypothetical protein